MGRAIVLTDVIAHDPARRLAGLRTGAANMSPALNSAGWSFACMLALMAMRVPIAISMFVRGVSATSTQVGQAPFLNQLNRPGLSRASPATTCR